MASHRPDPFSATHSFICKTSRPTHKKMSYGGTINGLRKCGGGPRTKVHTKKMVNINLGGPDWAPETLQLVFLPSGFTEYLYQALCGDTGGAPCPLPVQTRKEPVSKEKLVRNHNGLCQESCSEGCWFGPSPLTSCCFAIFPSKSRHGLPRPN